MIIKKLISCIRQYKMDTLLTPIFMILEVSMEVFIPFLMAKLIDNGIEIKNMNYILKMGMILLVSSLFSLSFGALSGTFAARASSGFAKNLREDMYYNIQSFSFSNIDKFSSASLITRITTDVTNVQNAFQMIIRIGVRSPIMLVLSLFASFSINTELSFIFLGIIPILATGLFFIIKKVHPIFENIFNTYDKLNKIVQENLRGIRVVKSYVREEYEIEKFEKISNIIYEDFTKAEMRIAFNIPLMQFSMYSSMILIAWIGAKLIINRSMTTGELMSIITYSMQILISLLTLSMVFVIIIMSKASSERIIEVLDEKTTITNCKNPVYDIKDGSIIFKNVGFSYRKNKNKLCLKNINLKIKSGETIGIIGSTGSSKTSLIQLIPRLYDVTYGAVLVSKKDVRSYDIKTLRDEISIVLQKNLLFSGTIRENLLWGSYDASLEDMVKACKIAQIHDFINNLPKGYDSHIEQGGSNISGGQKQRLCIARALLKKPKILILDDSTSAVDTKTDILIQKALKSEVLNITKIIISQRISSIKDADRIVVMESGEINAIKNHEKLLKISSIYKEIYDSQIKGGDFDEANQ